MKCAAYRHVPDKALHVGHGSRIRDEPRVVSSALRRVESLVDDEVERGAAFQERFLVGERKDGAAGQCGGPLLQHEHLDAGNVRKVTAGDRLRGFCVLK